jgi:hypothetical protein
MRTQKAWIVNEPEDEGCIANGEESWVEVDDTFPSGHTRPPVHPNCECDLVYRTIDDATSSAVRPAIANIG